MMAEIGILLIAAPPLIPLWGTVNRVPADQRAQIAQSGSTVNIAGGCRNPKET
jgi:hypothetical protein